MTLAVLVTASVAAIAANATTVTYNTQAAACKLVNSATWVSPACWAGGVVPTASSVVHFAPPTAKIDASLLDAAGTIQPNAMIAGGMVIGAQQVMVMHGGKFFIHGDVLVDGVLAVQALANDGTFATQMPNRDLIPKDAKARAAGYRDCAYLDWGFDSRVCGLGKLIVAKSGTVTVGNGAGLYASMFMEVEVHGKYILGGMSFQWKPVVNFGHMELGAGQKMEFSIEPAYLHASVFNKGTLIVPKLAVVIWDGYDKGDVERENFTQSAIVNEAGGLMNVSGLLSGTASVNGHLYNGTLVNWGELNWNQWPGDAQASLFDILNHNHTSLQGTLANTIESVGGVLELVAGTVVQGSIRSVGGKVVLRDDPFTCAGKKHGMTRFEPGASLAVMDAEVVLDGGELFAESFVAKNSRLTLVNEGKLNLHSASDDGYCWESVFKYCGCDACGEPSCEKGCICCSEGAVCPMQKSDAEFGTLQEPMGVMAKSWNSELNTDAGARANFTKSLRAMMKRPRPAKGAPYRFEGLEVGGDATGSIVASASLFVTGTDRHAMSVSNVTVFAIMEKSSPVFMGRGSVHIGSDATFVLGTDAALDAGGRLSVGTGGRVVVDAHSRLTVGDHAVSVEKGGSFVADGKVRFGAAARVHVCGTLVGEGAAPSFLGC